MKVEEWEEGECPGSRQGLTLRPFDRSTGCRGLHLPVSWCPRLPGSSVVPPSAVTRIGRRVAATGLALSGWTEAGSLWGRLASGGGSRPECVREPNWASWARAGSLCGWAGPSWWRLIQGPAALVASLWAGIWPGAGGA